jgi:hypothetical protein
MLQGFLKKFVELPLQTLAPDAALAAARGLRDELSANANSWLKEHVLARV